MKRALLIAVILLAGCQEKTVADWSGKWTGPEGTYLAITPKGPDTVSVTIRDLDGERIFPGTKTADGIAFARDKVTETIHAGNGVDTGMKWLTDKKNCLVVKSGEGYCRD